MPPDDWLTLEEVAKRLRVGKRTLQRMIADGRFPGPLYPTPGSAMWLAADLDTYRAWVALSPRMKAGQTVEDAPHGDDNG